MPRAFMITALFLVLGACKPPESGPITAGPSPSDDPVATNPLRAFGAGDVEFNTVTVATISPVNDWIDQPNIKNQEIEDQRERVTRVLTEIFPPYPAEIWVRVSTSCTTIYPDHAIHMKTHVFVDNEEVDSFEYITGDHAMEPHSKDIEVLARFTERPESIRVYGITDITLYKDTDESSIDAANLPEVAADAKATLLGAPLRIDFR